MTHLSDATKQISDNIYVNLTRESCTSLHQQINKIDYEKITFPVQEITVEAVQPSAKYTIAPYIDNFDTQKLPPKDYPAIEENSFSDSLLCGLSHKEDEDSPIIFYVEDHYRNGIDVDVMLHF